MKNIFFVISFCLLCLLFTIPVEPYEEPHPIKWSVSVCPENNRCLEVKLTILDGYAVKPELPFNAIYYDQNDNKLDELKAGFFEGEPRERKTPGSYTRYFEVEQPATKVIGGLMHYRVIGRPKPYSDAVPPNSPNK
jgi:hypothetical protein